MADAVQCILAIDDVKSSVQGNDPRTWMKACAIETLLKGKSGKHFKNKDYGRRSTMYFSNQQRKNISTR